MTSMCVWWHFDILVRWLCRKWCIDSDLIFDIVDDTFFPSKRIKGFVLKTKKHRKLPACYACNGITASQPWTVSENTLTATYTHIYTKIILFCFVCNPPPPPPLLCYDTRPPLSLSLSRSLWCIFVKTAVRLIHSTYGLIIKLRIFQTEKTNFFSLL